MVREPKTCFVIAPIGDEQSEIRKRSDQVFKHIIEQATLECGYHAVRADRIDKPGLITNQVIQHIVDDELVISDLTGHNPNVFYELALRHALRKPVIQIIEKGQKIPFDIAGARTIEFDHKDLDSACNAKESIKRQIGEIEAGEDDIENPISVSMEIKSLRESEEPRDRDYGRLLSQIGELNSAVAEALERGSFSDAALHLMEHQMLEVRDLFQRVMDSGPEKILPRFNRDNRFERALAYASIVRFEYPALFQAISEAYRLSLDDRISLADRILRKSAEIALYHIDREHIDITSTSGYPLGQISKLRGLSEQE